MPRPPLLLGFIVSAALVVSAAVLPACLKTGVRCASGQVACGDACVDTQADSNHCGVCGNACGPDQFCGRGACQNGAFTGDLVAACETAGVLVPVQMGTWALGPTSAVGTHPISLAEMDQTLLVLDTHDRFLYEARLPNLAQLPGSVQVGEGPNQVRVFGSDAYVLNSLENSLDVLASSGSDGGSGGPALSVVGSLSFGANADPIALDKVGDDLFVALYGGLPPDISPGQKVVRVSVLDPTHPAIAEQFDLSALDLHPFSGAHPSIPRPSAVLARDGGVYVALNNLDENYAPSGPGIVARIDLVTKHISVIDLGADACLQPTYLASVGSSLAVSCSGQANYLPPSFLLVSIDKAGLVLLDANDRRVATWSAQCPTADGGCVPALPGAVAATSTQLLLADQNAGRLFAVDSAGNQLVEIRGFNAGGGPLQACPLDPKTGISNVSDILRIR